MCGPCDSNAKKPNAGVCVLVRSDAVMTVSRGKIQTEAYQIAHDEGRAVKYHIDANWCIEAMCYIVYGQAGGSKGNKAKT